MEQAFEFSPSIRGLARGAMKAMVRETKVEPSLMLPMGLSYDHRVIDGAAAARFVGHLADRYGTRLEEVLGLVGRDPSLAAPIACVVSALVRSSRSSSSPPRSARAASAR